MGIANTIAGKVVNAGIRGAEALAGGARYAGSAAGAAANTAAEVGAMYPKTAIALGGAAGAAEGAALLSAMDDGDGPDAETPQDAAEEGHQPVSAQHVGHDKVRVYADTRDPQGAQFAEALGKFGYRPAETTESGATFVLSSREFARVQAAMSPAKAPAR